MKSEKYKFRKISGITLISLVITIIVLIILSSVAIYLSLGNNGIFTRAKQAKETTNKQTATEIINLKITTAQMDKYSEEQRMPTLKELSLILKEDDEIKYVTETSQIGSAEYKVGENPSSIYTKLKEYPYEFEINGQLQLASIDGVKLIDTNNNQIIGYPDYANVQTITFTNNSYTVENNGYIQFYFGYTKNLTNEHVSDGFYINNVICFYNSNYMTYHNFNTSLYLVKAGDVVSYFATAQNVAAFYYPFTK